jgi:hypothetical protein
LEIAAMQAVELSAHIGPDHELRITLPDHAAIGNVRVIVLFESAETTPAGGNLDAFLDRLPINAEGGLSHAQAVERIAAERAAWGDE